MRGRLLVLGAGMMVASPLAAQFPPASRPPSATPLPAPIAPPATPPNAPRMLPPAMPLPPASVPPQPGLPDGTTLAPQRVETPLPRPENRFGIDAGSVTVKRINGVWQVWMGQRLLKSLGSDEAGARDVVRVLHELHPTEWAAIGSPRPFVEYGLTAGRPAVTISQPKLVIPIDLRTVRVEPTKGVWCLRDDANILVNFGLQKGEAEQSLAVVRRYGFNRIGLVGGDPSAPAMTYLYAAIEADSAKPKVANPLAVGLQETALLRTGIPVPGVGYVGEMVRIDWQKTEARRDGADWVVACGGEAIARFGSDQAAARDAARLIQDGRFTEFCRAGAGITFFLVNGQAPTRVPLYVHGRHFDLVTLKAAKFGEKWAVTERGRHLFDVASLEEGEAVVRLLKAYQFDQLCHLGPMRSGLMFLARGR